MSEFLAYTVLGVVVGCIYAMTATGLVVTYTTTGIFNFAHGAIGMVAAFTFWQLTQGWHIPSLVSFLLVLLVIAPLFGILIERLLMRPLYGAPVDLTVVVTLGLLLALVGVANIAWKPSTVRDAPQFFAGEQFRLGIVAVTWMQVVVVVMAAALAVGLRMFFSRTRTGVAMRAVVDNPDLVAMAGGRPVRIQQLSWAIGCALASLAGIMLAPLTRLDVFQLTLLVINGYAAAMIGRLRNLPATVAGAIGIGLLGSYAVGYSPPWLAKVQTIIPMIVLFVVLILLPQDRLRAASFGGPVAPRPAGLRASLAWGAVLVVGAAVASAILSPANLRLGANGFAIAFILLSLVLLTGYGGLVSLAQMTFVGLGAFAMGHVGHGGSLVGAAAAVALAAAFGVVIALPTLRLRGLYLALATLAFAQAMDYVFFTNVLGTGGSINVDRLHIPGVPTASDQAFFVLCSVLFTLAAVGVLALRRGTFGRRLAALNDSPAACATLGVNINWTKLVVFATSAGIAGFGGVLFAGVTTIRSNNDFVLFLSLVILLLARVGGINTVTGALLGAFVFALYPVLQEHVPQLANVQYLLTGLAAISLGRDPNGMGGRISHLAERLRAPRASGAQIPAQPGTPGAAAHGEWTTKEDGLVRAGH